MAGLARLLQAVGLVFLVWYYSSGMLKAMDGYFGAQFGRYLKEKLHENKHMREDLRREREEMQRVLRSKGHTLQDRDLTRPPDSQKEKTGSLGTRGLALPGDPVTPENTQVVLEPDGRLTGQSDSQREVQLLLESKGRILAGEPTTPPPEDIEFWAVGKPPDHYVQQHEFCLLNSKENSPPGHCPHSQSEPSDRGEPIFSTAADLLASTEQCPSSSPEPVAASVASGSSYSDAVGRLVSVPDRYGKRVLLLKSDATNASELVVEVEVPLTAPHFP